jgi:hypothetical protein
MDRQQLLQVALAVGLSLMCVEAGDATIFPPGWYRPRLQQFDPTAWKAEMAPPPCAVGLPMLRYGQEPGIVANPYPWHTPTMFSGFRHYHRVPPDAFHGAEEFAPPGEQLELPPLQAPMPKTMPE